MRIPADPECPAMPSGQRHRHPVERGTHLAVEHPTTR
eukprot:ctg_2046.g325